MTVKVYISPQRAQIRDDNGIGRVIYAQFKYLPDHGIDLVDDPAAADVIACHIQQGEMPRVDCLHVHGFYWNGDAGSGQYIRWHSAANQHIADAARKALAITVPSPWVSEVFKRDMRLRPDVIGHGVDLDQWEPAEPRGYLLWNKTRIGDVCFPDAAIELARRGIPVVSTFGPLQGDTPPALTVIGTVPHDQMREHVRHATAYLATTKETFGIGTLEALAAGVPVLGYDFGGTSDLVQHEVTGYLVRPGDVDGLAAGLAYIMAHRTEMALATRAAAERYTWDRVMRQYAEVYQRVADERKAARTGVSVVITNFNYGSYVAEAIASCQAQTYVPDEIIVVDDGSTDDSREILASIPGIDVVYQANGGVASARNTGISRATHPYIACLDADDKLAPEYITTCRQALVNDRGVGIAYTGLSLYDGKTLSQNAWPPSFDWEMQTTPRNPPSNCIPCAAMFRRSLWERAGGYKQVYAPAEDTEFFMRGLATGYTARKVTDEGLFHYRVGHDSASRTKQYRPIDTWHPWMRDKQYPMAAPAATAPLVRSYSEPAVSVVIPVGPGHATRLIAALDSLLGQTCREWECIVVVDSPDYFPEDQPMRDILRPYPFVTVMGTAHAPAGPAAARNWGLTAVRAPLTLFLDADDYLMPTALETMLRAFVLTGGKYIYSDWLAVGANGASHDEAPEYTQQGWLQNGQHAVTALLPTAWVRAVGGFDESMVGWEDWDFYIKFAIAGYCGARVPEALLAYRQTTGTVRERSLAAKDELLSVLRERYADYATGVKPMGSCCGGNGDAILAARFAIGGGQTFDAPTPDTLPGVVRMEFIGPQVGAITFFGANGRHQYRGGNNNMDRYVDVQPEDVRHLEGSGHWRVVTRAPEPSVPPAMPLMFEQPEPELVAVGEPAAPSRRRR